MLSRAPIWPSPVDLHRRRAHREVLGDARLTAENGTEQEDDRHQEEDAGHGHRLLASTHSDSLFAPQRVVSERVPGRSQRDAGSHVLHRVHL